MQIKIIVRYVGRTYPSVAVLSGETKLFSIDISIGMLMHMYIPKAFGTHIKQKRVY